MGGLLRPAALTRPGTGTAELGQLLSARTVAELPEALPGRWEEDLEAIGPALTAARAAVDEGCRLLVAEQCTVAIATLPDLVLAHPGLQIAWFDAHPDFNTPGTSASGFLGGMPLAHACGVWGEGGGVDPASVHLVGIRDVDPGEAELVARHGLRTGLPEEGPVFVHLDLDVLDNELMPADYPAPGGWDWDELDAALAALPDLVGIEVVGCAPGRAERVADTLARL